MKHAFGSLIILVVIFGCSNSNKGKPITKDSLPACVMKEIAAIEKKTNPNPPVQIDEYLYHDKRVFLYTADCCDQFNILYDVNCKSICAPGGGLEGGGDHKCGDFSATAKHVTLIWKNPAK